MLPMDPCDLYMVEIPCGQPIENGNLKLLIRLYGAPLGSVNFDGEIFCPSSVAEIAANSESLQDRAMRWGEKDAEKNSLDLTAGRIQ